MILVRTSAPAIEPLTIAEVERHLRLDGSNKEPVPSAPSVALAGAGAGNVDNGAHRYRVTFVTADGETDGGDLSSAVTVVDKTANGKVNLTGIQVGGSFVTARKVYRTTAGGTSYLLLTTIADNTTTTYTDNTADASLGAGVPSSNTTSDPEIRRFLKTARESVEEYCRRALITQTWRLVFDAFPDCGEILLPRPNVLSLTSLKYDDWEGVEQTVDPAIYALDTNHFPGRIIRNWNQSWPLARPQQNAVRALFTAGYGPAASDVPEAIKSAILITITDLYEQRQSVVIGTIVNLTPLAKNLLNLHRYEEA